jgi:2Fe-2S ferredoxin
MKPKSTICITFLPAEQDVLVSQDCPSVLEAALAAKISLDHTCGGNATCGTCYVRVLEGLEKLGPRNEVETEFAHERGFKDHERLTCQMKPVNGLVLEIPTKA